MTMGEVWIKEAQDLTPAGTSGVMEGGKPRVTWHVTVSPSGGGYFDSMHRVLVGAKSEPHILYDPATDRLGQYFPLNRSARALGNDGTRRTNGAGIVNIQIEVVANTSPVFTSYWQPGPNFRALMRAIRSWGIPDVWPAGRLATNYADKVDRSWSSYLKAGHFGHANVPGNDHWDPGPIDQQAIFRAAAMPVPVNPTPPVSEPIQEVGLAADDVQKVNEYTAALLLNGYTAGGVQKPSVLAVLVETQRRVTALANSIQPAAIAAAVAQGIVASGADVNVDDLAKAIVLELGKGTPTA